MLKNFILALHFLATILNFSFCYLVLKYSIRKLSHLFLAGIAFFSGIYPLTILLGYITQNPFWARLTHIGYFIPFFFLLFTLALTQERNLKLKAFLSFLPLPFIIYLALFTNLVIYDINLKVFPSTGGVGPLDFIGRIYLIVLLGIGFFNLIKTYQKSHGFQKTQLKYFLLGVTIYSIVGVFATGILPILLSSAPSLNLITEFPAFFSIFWVGLSSYAVLRYRLMDINVVFGRGMVYFLSFATVLALAYLLIFLNIKFASFLPLNILFILIVVLSIFLFQSVFKIYERFAQKYFYCTFYNTQVVLTELGEKLIQVLELDKVSSLIIDTLTQTIKLDKISFAFKQPTSIFYQFQKTIGFEEKSIGSLIRDTCLCVYLEETQKILVTEEIPSILRKIKEKEKKEKLKFLEELLKRSGVALVLPLFQKRRIVGILFLGEKLSGNPYSKEDIELLENLSYQMAISLQNSLLYEEIKKDKEIFEKFYEKMKHWEARMIQLHRQVKELETKLKEKEEKL